MNTFSLDKKNTSAILSSINKFVSNKFKGGADESKKGGTSGRTVPKKLVEVKSKVYAINTNRTPYNPSRKFAHAAYAPRTAHSTPRRLSPVNEDIEELIDIFRKMNPTNMLPKVTNIDDMLESVNKKFASMTTSAMARNRATKAIKGTRKSIKKPSTKPEKMSIEPTRRSARVSKAPSKLSTSSKGKSYRNK